MSPILCISDFELQCKLQKKFFSNHATKKRRRKLKVFCIYGTVALQSPIPTFLRLESYSSSASIIARTPNLFNMSGIYIYNLPSRDAALWVDANLTVAWCCGGGLCWETYFFC